MAGDALNVRNKWPVFEWEPSVAQPDADGRIVGPSHGCGQTAAARHENDWAPGADPRAGGVTEGWVPYRARWEPWGLVG